MKKELVLIGSIAGVVAVVLAMNNYFAGSNSNTRRISVSGECLTSAPKDRTAITLRVQTLDKNAAVSMKMATDRITEITNFIKTQDVKMQTTQFDSYEKTEWDNKLQKSVSLGIETTIAIEVSADKIDKIETILNKFAGEKNVFSENLHMFTSDETLKPIIEKCLGTAVENARERANAIASGDGRKAGRLVSVDYTSSNVNTFRPQNFARGFKTEMANASLDVGGGLVSKDTEVSVSVGAVFEIR
jgi:uncharacterized protein YggE